MKEECFSDNTSPGGLICFSETTHIGDAENKEDMCHIDWGDGTPIDEQIRLEKMALRHLHSGDEILASIALAAVIILAIIVSATVAVRNVHRNNAAAAVTAATIEITVGSQNLNLSNRV